MEIVIMFIAFVIGVIVLRWLDDPVMPYRGILPPDDPPGKRTKKTKRK